jgi:hypothetical protein
MVRKCLRRVSNLLVSSDSGWDCSPHILAVHVFLDLRKRVRGMDNFLGEVTVCLGELFLMLLEDLVLCFRLFHPFDKSFFIEVAVVICWPRVMEIWLC